MWDGQKASVNWFQLHHKLMRHWNRLPRKVLESLDMFQKMWHLVTLSRAVTGMG